jgi:hypothetical protein
MPKKRKRTASKKSPGTYGGRGGAAVVGEVPGKCNSPLRRKPGRLCGQNAGHKTDHPGVGRCWLHAGRPPSHGRYSSIKSTSLRELYEKHMADPEPLNIEPELAHARAIFQDFLERYDAWREALLAWHESYRTGGNAYSDAVRNLRETIATKDPAKIQAALKELEEASRAVSGKPTQILDQADAYRILSEITKIVERIERIKAQNAISRPDMLRTMSEMGRVVERHVTDEETRERIKDGWLEIRIA